MAGSKAPNPPLVRLPNSTLYGPIILRGLVLNPGASIFRTLGQFVPAGAPAGQYEYIGRVGPYPVIWAEDSFPFEKE